MKGKATADPNIRICTFQGTQQPTVRVARPTTLLCVVVTGITLYGT